MPDDLLSGASIVAHIRAAMTEDACASVEVIGWLYQYYISEKKDAVFEALKGNKKITPENIPAATQLFTPHWIVRYLVENSLGRLWMLNRPQSSLVQGMAYYVPSPAAVESEKWTVGSGEFLRVESVEDLKICDPACGSGHMLTYAFDLLFAIYEEEGYTKADIAQKILQHNVYGMEIDERAASLASFALTMKAREKDRRFFGRGVVPNICVLENVRFAEKELDMFWKDSGMVPTDAFLDTIRSFENAKNMGSLVRPQLTEEESLKLWDEIANVKAGHMLMGATADKLLSCLTQARYLSHRYHAVIANPPYMGGKGMNAQLAAWAKKQYPNSKSDLFAMFIARCLELAVTQRTVGMITMQSWMFLSSFEKLRKQLLDDATLLSMAHLGARAFDSIGGEVVATTAFVLQNSALLEYQGDYVRLVDGISEVEKNAHLQEAIQNPSCGWFYRACATDFAKIPGSPIAYWLSENFLSLYSLSTINDISTVKTGLQTGDNSLFLRQWYEIARKNIKFDSKNKSDFISSSIKWLPQIKGGTYRKWYGNLDYILNWSCDGEEIRQHNGARLNVMANDDFFCKQGITWSHTTTTGFAARFMSQGSLFNVEAPSCFIDNKELEKYVLGFFNSHVAQHLLDAVNATFHYLTSDIKRLPIRYEYDENVYSLVLENIAISKADWDSYETSWDFTTLPLLSFALGQDSLPTIHYPLPTGEAIPLSTSYKALRAHWQPMTDEMHRLEEENNRIFIDAYGLENELTPDVPLKEITLTCNPAYRYGGEKTVDELEALLRADTMREYISYAVGCMFGRYSLDKEGLILANQGQTLHDYSEQVPHPRFAADADNVIPILEGHWFQDDIVDRFYAFLKVTFGEEHVDANLRFIEEALGKNIRKYFLKDFYNDHVKRYKKRPIYWLFSSPKGHFNALIYMHRYRPETVNVVLNEYLRQYSSKLETEMTHQESLSVSVATGSRDKTRALKRVAELKRILLDVNAYEHDTLYPLATQKIAIDLDDGVKVNYQKFGKALKKIAGLDAKEE